MLAPSFNAHAAKVRGRRTLSLDTTGSGAIAEASIIAPLPEAIDVEAVAAHLRLDADSAAFFEATAIDGLSWPRAVERLGWTAQRGERVRKRLARLLKRIREGASFDVSQFVLKGDSRHLAFKERLAAGSCWTLAEIGPGFAEIMRRERAQLFQTKCPREQL